MLSGCQLSNHHKHAFVGSGMVFEIPINVLTEKSSIGEVSAIYRYAPISPYCLVVLGYFSLSFVDVRTYSLYFLESGKFLVCDITDAVLFEVYRPLDTSST